MIIGLPPGPPPNWAQTPSGVHQAAIPSASVSGVNTIPVYAPQAANYVASANINYNAVDVQNAVIDFFTELYTEITTAAPLTNGTIEEMHERLKNFRPTNYVVLIEIFRQPFRQGLLEPLLARLGPIALSDGEQGGPLRIACNPALVQLFMFS